MDTLAWKGRAMTLGTEVGEDCVNAAACAGNAKGWGVGGEVESEMNGRWFLGTFAILRSEGG